MKRHVILFLDDILSMIEVVEATLTNKTRRDFESDFMLQLGIQRAIEIISEASRHIPVFMTDEAPQIPWNGEYPAS